MRINYRGILQNHIFTNTEQNYMMLHLPCHTWGAHRMHLRSLWNCKHSSFKWWSCISVPYLWKYGFAKSSDNLYALCITV